MDINGEMQFLLDKWHGKKPMPEDVAFSEYSRDRDRYFELKSELQIQQAEQIYGSKRELRTIGDKEIMTEIGDAVLAWRVGPDKIAEVLIKRK